MKLPVQMPINGTLVGAHFAQVADRGFIDLRAGVEDASNDDHVVERSGGMNPLVGSINTPQLAGTDSWRLAMIDHCTCSGRLRSPSSAARRR